MDATESAPFSVSEGRVALPEAALPIFRKDFKGQTTSRDRREVPRFSKLRSMGLFFASLFVFVNSARRSSQYLFSDF